MTENTEVIGRAKTAFVCQDENQKAVISTIIIRRIGRSRKRLCFVGTVNFSKPIKNHIKKIILPIVDQISRQLDMPLACYEISAVNIGAASALDIGVKVSGFSADVATFTALLSASFGIPVDDGYVSTGHIASVEGDIRTVRSIPAKLKAATNDGSVKCFIYGDPEKDRSMRILSPCERNRSIDAIMAAREFIHTMAVSNIGQLIRQVFTEESIIWAGLREGFFCTSMIPNKFNNPIHDVISFLTCNNLERFWNVMYCLFNKEPEKGKDLLRTFAQFYIDRPEYPKCFGARLFQLMRSLSSVVRIRIDLPILDRDLCNDLISFAKKSDYDDRRILLNTIDCKNTEDTCPVSTQPEFKLSDSECTVFNTIVSLINEQALARKFSAIDSARASFILESLKVKSQEELINILQAYYIHMQRYTGSSPEKPDISEARCEAIELLKSTFRNKGGDKAAFVQARDCTQGGIRSIIDMITEQYKAQKQDAYISRVFKDAIADMELQERVKCIKAVIKEVGRFLPEELKNQPPEKFARSDETIETIIRTYVKCSDRFNQSLSRM